MFKVNLSKKNPTTWYETYFNFLDYRFQLWNTRFEKITLRYIIVDKKMYKIYNTFFFFCTFSFTLFWFLYFENINLLVFILPKSGVHQAKILKINIKVLKGCWRCYGAPTDPTRILFEKNTFKKWSYLVLWRFTF